ncbi:hypothetical protein [Lysobacter sp. ESA13C]|uniref:hypothetical protein n=1 Tax=Lysobacter sp. ESA13C TaxID=2862676 RepID=UPI001CBCD65A|nr:hypothetical protein [Lysobacter sp. ESA13C]
MKTGYKFGAALAVVPLSLLLTGATGNGYWMIGLPLGLVAVCLYGNDFHGELVKATDMKAWSLRRVMLQLPQFATAVVCVIGGVIALAVLLWSLRDGQELGTKSLMAVLLACFIAGGIALFIQGIRGPAPEIKDWFAVEFDDVDVRIRANPPRSSPVDTGFPWASIERVIFEDGGFGSSDVFYLFTSVATDPFVVLTEGEGGAEFSGALCERGHFPPEIFAQAMRSSGGGCYVWPPATSAE